MAFEPYKPPDTSGLTPYQPQSSGGGLPTSALGSAFDNFSTGLAKGGLSTLKGIGTIGQKILDKTVNKIPGVNAGSDIYRPNTQTGQKASSLLSPQGTAQKAGFATEQLAEFFIPASKAAKLEQSVNLLSAGSTGLKASGIRIAGKAAVQGVAAGAVTFAQTGGDLKQSAKTAATAGIVRGGLATIGEGARALKIPERLYSTIFKNSKRDMLQELRADGLAKLQQTNPSQFDDFVKKGIIKFTNGNPTINETLAERALHKGLRGTIRGMSNEVIGKTLQAEDDARRIAQTYSGKVSFSEPQFLNVLKRFASDYEDVGFGELSKEASYYASKLESSKGSLTGIDALNFRRFLDKMRLASSFDRPASSLSLTQSNLKTLADTARGRLNKIPGMSPVMKDYAFYMEALEALAKEASRRGNNQVISLIDSIFLGGGLSSVNPAPLLTIGVLRRLILSGPGMTFAGQLLQKSSASPLSAGLLGGASRGIINQITNQQQ